MSENKNQQKQIKIEYEGQSYQVDADKIEGLDDGQILNLLSVGFPGIANGKLERLPDGSIKIVKRVGTKGNNRLLDLLYRCPEDPLPMKIEGFNQQLTEELTLAQWEEIYETMDFEKIEQILAQRKRLISSIIVRLYRCPTKIVPLI